MRIMLTLFVTAILLVPGFAAASDTDTDTNTGTGPATDACAGKSRNDACHIRGGSFSGGGKGVCAGPRAKDSRLSCRTEQPRIIDHGLAPGAMMAPPELCKPGAHPHGWSCMVPAPVTDEACEKLLPGQLCEVDMTVSGVRGLHRGVCRHEEEIAHENAHGWIRLWRPVVVCVPLKIAPAASTP